MCSFYVKAQTKYPYIQKSQDGTIEYVFNYEQANYVNNELDAKNFLDSILAAYEINDVP